MLSKLYTSVFVSYWKTTEIKIETWPFWSRDKARNQVKHSLIVFTVWHQEITETMSFGIEYLTKYSLTFNDCIARLRIQDRAIASRNYPRQYSSTRITGHWFATRTITYSTSRRSWPRIWCRRPSWSTARATRIRHTCSASYRVVSNSRMTNSYRPSSSTPTESKRFWPASLLRSSNRLPTTTTLPQAAHQQSRRLRRNQECLQLPSRPRSALDPTSIRWSRNWRSSRNGSETDRVPPRPRRRR